MKHKRKIKEKISKIFKKATTNQPIKWKGVQQRPKRKQKEGHEREGGKICVYRTSVTIRIYTQSSHKYEQFYVYGKRDCCYINRLASPTINGN